jgi:hypothetical protein
MPNFETGDNQLSKEGVVPPAAAEEALAAHKEELDEITQKAQQVLSEHGGDFEIAIAESEANGDASVVEKLQVMRNVAETQN